MLFINRIKIGIKKKIKGFIEGDTIQKSEILTKINQKDENRSTWEISTKKNKKGDIIFYKNKLESTSFRLSNLPKEFHKHTL